MSYRVVVAASAARDLERLPPRVLPAIVEFIYGPLAENPHRTGKPLTNELAGLHGARRADYRVLYRIDEADDLVLVVRVASRSSVYRPR